MKVEVYKCDRCGVRVDSAVQIHILNDHAIDPPSGRTEYWHKTLDLCPGCTALMLQVMVDAHVGKDEAKGRKLIEMIAGGKEWVN